MNTESNRLSHLLTLTIQQQNAIELLLTGISDREVADSVGVRRETVTKWRHRHPAFRAELNRRREELWDISMGRLRGLIPRAIEALEQVMADPTHPQRARVAMEIVKLANLPEISPRHWGPDTPEGVIRSEAIWRKQKESLAFLLPDPDEGDIEAVVNEIESDLT